MKMRSARIGLVGGALALLVGCQGDPELGTGGSMIQGSAGATGSDDGTVQLAHCDRPIGNASLVEPSADLVLQLNKIDLESPTPLLRLMMAQSNCFQVVDMSAIVEPGNRAKVHYSIRPNIVFSNPNAGGYGGLGAVGSAAFGWVGAIVGAAAGALRIQEAQTVLFLNDATTGLQKAAAEGSAKVTDFGGAGGLAGWGSGLGAGGAAGGYGKTAEGKLIAAAFLDAYNNLVGQLGGASVQTASATVASAAEPPTFAPDAAYTPNMLLNVRGGPGTDHDVIGSAGPGATLTTTGERQGTWWQVDNAGQTGWVSARHLRPM